jgi:predicted DNA binding CopG/RHH family protein
MKRKYNPKYIDAEEKDLMESIEELDVKKIKTPTPKEQKELKGNAKRFLKQESKMNIRIDPYELEKIKEQAAREGLKYQSFVKSVLHKYITGQLVESRKRSG